jgi:hypothetical protein
MTVQPKADQPSAETGADQCRHRMKRKQRAFSEITDHGVEKKEQEEFSQERAVSLDLPHILPSNPGPLELSKHGLGSV